MAKFEVIHPIRHDGKHHDRGASIELGTKDALPLVKAGVVKPVDSVARPASDPIDFESFTKQQLVDYAQVKHGVTLSLSTAKSELVEAVIAAVAAAKV